MALDDVVSSTVTGPRVEEAMYRTVRWIDRCIKAHKRPHDQNLFGIIQGGLEPKISDICLKEFNKRDLPGFAIGGLSGGESKDDFWKIVSQCTSKLPPNKPRYLMGVGFPVDLVVCVALGVDMFDCVYPTRTARFGTALAPSGLLNLKGTVFANDFRPVDETCSCYTCIHYSRSYLHFISRGESLCGVLLSYHNIAYQSRLMSQARQSIIDGKFTEFVVSFMENQFPKKDYPTWVTDALSSVNIHLIS